MKNLGTTLVQWVANAEVGHVVSPFVLKVSFGGLTEHEQFTLFNFPPWIGERPFQTG